MLSYKLKKLIFIVIVIIILGVIIRRYSSINKKQGSGNSGNSGNNAGNLAGIVERISKLFGNQSDTTAHLCKNVKCHHEGICDIDTGWCSCPPDRWPPLCEKKKEKCTQIDCSNNGLPRKTYPTGTETNKECNCDCNPGFVGSDCSKSYSGFARSDVSKSKCLLDKTCSKNGDGNLMCNKNHYKAETSNNNNIDCKPCPQGTNIPDLSHNGSNKEAECRCIVKAGDVDDKYMDLKTKKCVLCINKWKIHSGQYGKRLNKPKDNDGNYLTDWVLYDKESINLTGTHKDCKCNNAKNYYNSSKLKNTCIKCFEGSKLRLINGVEICKCEVPSWKMVLVTLNGGKLVPKCILNETCKNPIFDSNSQSVHYCANRSYFGNDFNKKDIFIKDYTEFAHPEEGQIKCELKETKDEKDARLIKEKSTSDNIYDVMNKYLEEGEKINTVNTMIQTSKEHISKNEFDNALYILNRAKLIALGYNGIDDKSKWSPYSFKTSGRIEVLSPPLVEWPIVQANELKPHNIGRIVFSELSLSYGKIIEGSTLKLLTKCGTNPADTIIKVDKISNNKNNPGVIPASGYNLDAVLSSQIIGNDCRFQRIKDIKNETTPLDELYDQIKPINDLIEDAKKKKSDKRLNEIEADNSRIINLKQSLHNQDLTTGCIDTNAGNETAGFLGETKCMIEAVRGKCETEFAIRNCRKTCMHNLTTCGKKNNNNNDDTDFFESLKNSWEEF